MRAEGALLDTDTISYIMRRDPSVMARAAEYRQAGQRYALSIVTRYEVLSGLMWRGAQRQLERFDRFCALSDVLPLTEDVAMTAARIYAGLRSRGEPLDDADILIAATALVHGLVLVTNNDSHFGRIPDLRLDNWAR